MPDFSKLNVKAEDVKAPVPLPDGVYTLMVMDYEIKDYKNNKGEEGSVVEVQLQVRDRISGDGDLPDKLPKMRENFYLTDAALYRLKNFIEACGVSLEGRTLGEGLSDVKNQLVGAKVGKGKPNADGKQYAEIKEWCTA